MPVVTGSGQIEASNFQVGLAEFPAGSTLLSARLAVYTCFSTSNTSYAIGYAPPNTILGISWRPGGTAPELPTDANITDDTWYVAGYGTLIASDVSQINTGGGAPDEANGLWTYSQILELAQPAYQESAYSVGIAANFKGAGYWSDISWYLTYQYEARYI